MFTQLGGLLNNLFNDITGTFITLFSIAILITALLSLCGGEENQSKFKRAFLLSLICLIFFLLAKPIVAYFQSNL